MLIGDGPDDGPVAVPGLYPLWFARDVVGPCRCRGRPLLADILVRRWRDH